MPTRTVAVVGGCTKDLITIVDRIPDEGETVFAHSHTMHEGGKGANSAVAIHRLTRNNPNPKSVDQIPTSDASASVPTTTTNTTRIVTVDPDNDILVRMVGAVGGRLAEDGTTVVADDFGRSLKEKLASSGVNEDGVRIVVGSPTAVATILVEDESRANRIMQHTGAANTIMPSDFLTPESLGGGVRPDLVVCQLEIRRESIEQAIQTAHEAKIEVLLNPSPATWLYPEIFSMVTHLIMNETEAIMLSDIHPPDMKTMSGWVSVAKHFTDMGVKNVVITLGEQGAYFKNEHGDGQVKALENVNVLDTTGAGYVKSPFPHLQNAFEIHSFER